MPEIIEETVRTADDTVQPVEPRTQTTVRATATSSEQAYHLTDYLFGILETLLMFRFVLKLLGANSASFFVGFIYQITSIFVMPFEGIIRRFTTQGVETTAVFEFSTLVAIVVYALIALAVSRFIRITSRTPEVQD